MASYQSKINALKGVELNSTVTLHERIDACVKENCADILRGDLVKNSIINNNEFSDQQLIEFSLRGVRGLITSIILPCFLADSGIDTDNTVTDAQLDTTFLYVTWCIAKLIGTQYL